MALYQRILVPLDGSKRAEAILLHVEDMAQCYQAQVILLQVIEPRPLLIDGTYAVPDLVEHEEHFKTAEGYLQALQGKLHKKGLEVKIQVAQGPVVTEIIDTAEREKVDLIAMASHGRTGLARVFYGSVAAGVLHRIDRPLLLVRSEDSE